MTPVNLFLDGMSITLTLRMVNAPISLFFFFLETRYTAQVHVRILTPALYNAHRFKPV